jgi:hypothetical protein
MRMSMPFVVGFALVLAPLKRAPVEIRARVVQLPSLSRPRA